MERLINVGLVGYGVGGGVFHAPIINSVSNLHLHSIVTRNPVREEEAKNSYPWIYIVNDLETLLSNKKIELIVIATPNTLHKEMAKKALLAGKHVVVDKPFTTNSKDADELIELAKEQGKILTVHHNRRWDSDFLTVKKIIEGNLLGNLVEYEAHFDRFRNYIKENSWKEENLPGGGVLFDLGSHLIDQALLLFGLPKEVTGDLRIQRRGSKVLDYFEIILGYENLKVSLQSGMLVRELGPHFILKGDKGSFVKYGMDVQEETLKQGITPLDIEDWGIEPKEIWGTLNTDIKDLHCRGTVESLRGDYRVFYENIGDAIMGKEELLVKASQARDVIKIIEIAMKSNKEKRTIFLK